MQRLLASLPRSAAAIGCRLTPCNVFFSQVRHKMHQTASRKRIVWMRRNAWFHHEWALDAAIPRRGLPTRTFPNGVPMTRIRKFTEFAGRAWKVNTGRRRRMK